MSYRHDHQAVLAALDVARAEFRLERRRRQLAEAAARTWASAQNPSAVKGAVKGLLSRWNAALIGVAIIGATIGLVQVQRINEMFREAGWGAWMVVGPGLTAAVLSLRYLVRPCRQRLWLAALATASVVAFGMAGLLAPYLRGVTGMWSNEGLLWLVLSEVQERSSIIVIAGGITILNVALLACGRWWCGRSEALQPRRRWWCAIINVMSLTGIGWWVTTTPALKEATLCNLVVLATGLIALGLGAMYLSGRQPLWPLVVGALVALKIVALMGTVLDIDWSVLFVTSDDIAIPLAQLIGSHMVAANNLRVAVPFVVVVLGLLALAGKPGETAGSSTVPSPPGA